MVNEESNQPPQPSPEATTPDTRMLEARRQALEDTEKRLRLVDEAGNPLSREAAQQRIADYMAEISDQALKANEEGRYDQIANERYFIGSVLAIDANYRIARGDLRTPLAADRLRGLYAKENVFAKKDAGGTTTPRAILENAANSAPPPAQSPNSETK